MEETGEQSPARRNRSTSHIAMQERREGKFVAWTEHVTDEQYRKG